MADESTDDSIYAILNRIKGTEAPLSNTESALGYARSVLSGPTFNFGDNLEAAIFAPFTDKTYSEELAGVREEQERFKRLTDYTDNLTEIAASVFNPIGTYGKIGGASKLALNESRLLPSLGEVINTVDSIPISKTIQHAARSIPAQGALSGWGASDGEDPLRSALMGAGVGTAGSVFANKLGTTFAKPGYEADRLMTSAYGVGSQQISRTINKMSNPAERILEAEGLPIVKSLEKYSKAGLINPEQSLTERVGALTGHQTVVGNQLGDLLTIADEAIPPIKDFRLDTVHKYIDKIEGPGREQALKDADEIYDALARRIGNGSLADIQRLKVGLNGEFGPNDSVYKPKIEKAFRADLMHEIEDRVDSAVARGQLPGDMAGQVRLLNREWGDINDLSQIYARNRGKDYGSDIIQDVTSSASTTSGSPLGGAMIASAASGNPGWLAAAALGRAANLPSAKAKFADVFRDAERIKIVAPIAHGLEEFGTARTFEQIFESTEAPKPYEEQQSQQRQQPDIAQEILRSLEAIKGNTEKSANKSDFFIQEMKNKSSAPEGASEGPSAKPMSLEDFQPLEPDKTIESGTKAGMKASRVNYLANSVFGDNKPMQNKPPEIRAVEAQIDADPYTKTLYEFESSRNPYAKNPNSSAKGGFQFIDATARSMGLEDPMDLGASFETVKRLTDENRARFGDDPILLYSAHYLGATVLGKLQDGKPLTAKEAEQVRTLRDKLIPKFKRMYEANLKNILV